MNTTHTNDKATILYGVTA